MQKYHLEPIEIISIPAPARGATHYQPATQGDCADFNSRPCARGDATPLIYRLRSHLFQFPPLREGRPNRLVFQRNRLYFNSRPCARGDQ